MIGLTVAVSPEILRPISPSNQPHAVTLQHILPVTIAGEVTVTGSRASTGTLTLHHDGRLEGVLGGTTVGG